MANNKPPVHKFPRLASCPSGYILGRASPGVGDVELLTMAKLQSVGLIPTSLPPSGPAGGDLSGTYPNPTVSGLQTRAVSASAPGNLNVLAYSTGGSAWAPLLLGTAAYSNSYLDLANLPPLTGGTAGQVLTKNSGTNYDFSWQAASGGGAPSSFWLDASGDGYMAIVDSNAQLVLDSHGNGIYVKDPVLPAAMIPPLKGVTDGSAAAAGIVGEYMSASVVQGSALALTNNTPLTITSITLTPGDWDVSCDGFFTGNAATTVGQLIANISETTNTNDFTLGFYNTMTQNGQLSFNYGNPSVHVGPVRKSFAVPTTVYLIAFAAFAVNTCSGYGFINARRVR